MKKLFFLFAFIVAINCQAQWIKIYPNGGLITAIDSSTRMATHSALLRIQTNDVTQKIYLTVGNREFPERVYSNFKDSLGANLASSYSDLLYKLGQMQKTVTGSSGGSGSGGVVSITPINNTFSCLEKTVAYTLASNTYKEITIAGRDGAIYTLQTGSNPAITGITTGRYFTSTTGLITTVITVTPTTGIIDICTKQ